VSARASFPFRPDYAIPPGETLRDQLLEMELSQSELAARAGLSTKHVNQIIQGIAPITVETALLLERITGVPAKFWNRREADYREALIRARPPEVTADDEEWLASLPLKELQKRHRVPSGLELPRRLQAVLSFFGVADRAAWARIWKKPVASFRRSTAYRSAPGTVITWLRLAELEAQELGVAQYSAQGFRKALDEIRSLTANGDGNELVGICAAVGVAVVFVREVPGCRISGAAWWASPTRAVIALSDRYKKDDRFWFSFFHEAAHVLLHSKRETYVDDGTDDDLLEDEANRYAANFLIPPEQSNRLAHLTTEEEVKAFARELGIAPGIVVGRLQHEHTWDWSQGNGLKRAVWIVD
jgi:HTH-type transcriptional regulator / antitoxin HigA